MLPSRLKILLRPSLETEYERVMMTRALGRGAARARAWLNFALVGAAVLFAANAQSNVNAQLNCLAENIYFEARSEPDNGKVAVSHVVLNRVADPRFPATVCDVVRQDDQPGDESCQFSWWCDGQSNKPIYRGDWTRARDLASKVYWSETEDPTNGALWYHATYSKPIWRLRLRRGPKIGVHVFYWDKPRKKTGTG